MSRTKTYDAAFKTEIEELMDKLVTTKRPWSLRRARRHFERAYTEYMIQRTGNDRQLAAEKLDIGFSTLKEKIRKTKP